jgi:hypothetical protein
MGKWRVPVVDEVGNDSGGFGGLVFVLVEGGFLNLHIVELFTIEDFATFKTLDKFGVIVAADDTYLGMLAGGRHGSFE